MEINLYTFLIKLLFFQIWFYNICRMLDTLHYVVPTLPKAVSINEFKGMQIQENINIFWLTQ